MINQERMQTLIPLLKSGDEAARLEIISVHLPLAYKIAHRFCYGRQPVICDSIHAEANVGVVLAVERAKTELKDFGITPFIISWVKGTIQGFLQKDHLIQVPKSTYFRLLEEGKQPEEIMMTVFSISGLDKEHSEEHSLSSCSIPPRESRKLITHQLIKSLRLNDTQKMVLQHLLKGYHQIEIASVLNCHTTRISQIIRELRQKYIEAYLRHEELLPPKTGCDRPASRERGTSDSKSSGQNKGERKTDNKDSKST